MPRFLSLLLFFCLLTGCAQPAPAKQINLNEACPAPTFDSSLNYTYYELPADILAMSADEDSEAVIVRWLANYFGAGSISASGNLMNDLEQTGMSWCSSSSLADIGPLVAANLPLSKPVLIQMPLAVFSSNQQEDSWVLIHAVSLSPNGTPAVIYLAVPAIKDDKSDSVYTPAISYDELICRLKLLDAADSLEIIY